MEEINWSAVNNILEIPKAVNDSTNSGFAIGVFYMIFIVLVLLLTAFGFEVAIIVSAFIMFIVAIPMVYLGLIPMSHMITMVSVMIFMFFYIVWSSKKSQQN